MKRKTLYICMVIFIIIGGSFFYFSKSSPQSNDSRSKAEDDYQPTYDYLEANGCDFALGMSNYAYTVCAENALKKIQTEKKQYYDRFQESMKNMDKNALGLDEKFNKEFQDWYKNSDEYSHSRCLADRYFGGAGSGYKQSVFICQIHETQRDIELLDQLYMNREYFRG